MTAASAPSGREDRERARVGVVDRLAHRGDRQAAVALVEAQAPAYDQGARIERVDERREGEAQAASGVLYHRSRRGIAQRLLGASVSADTTAAAHAHSAPVLKGGSRASNRPL
jgi:hypothetical protein